MKKTMKKLSKIILPTIASLFLFSGIASAHVTVKPNVSAPGAYETYTIKIPVEKEVPTTKVTLKVPNGLELESYQPEVGWKVTTTKTSSGKVTSITWAATGEGILPGQFQQFNFVAKNPDKEGQAPWDAYQYYKDGSIVEWTGNEKSQTPHSITQITTSQAAPSMSHDHHDMSNVETNKNKDESDHSNSSTLTLSLSILAAVLSIIALIIAFRKKK